MGESWARRAACAGADPGAFFPASLQRPTEALATCATCPVRPECLDYAITHKIEHGVWGGLTRLQRRRLWAATPRRHPSPPTPTTTGRDPMTEQITRP